MSICVSFAVNQNSVLKLQQQEHWVTALPYLRFAFQIGKQQLGRSTSWLADWRHLPVVICVARTPEENVTFTGYASERSVQSNLLTGALSVFVCLYMLDVFSCICCCCRFNLLFAVATAARLNLVLLLLFIYAFFANVEVLTLFRWRHCTVDTNAEFVNKFTASSTCFHTCILCTCRLNWIRFRFHFGFTAFFHFCIYLPLFISLNIYIHTYYCIFWLSFCGDFCCFGVRGICKIPYTIYILYFLQKTLCVSNRYVCN